MSKVFTLGEEVWLALVNWSARRVPCPDCAGKRFLTVILGDDTYVTVDCPECSAGYLGSLGDVGVYDYEATVELAKVTGVELSGTKMRYHLAGHYGVEDTDVFATSEEAQIRATVLAENLAQKREERLKTKEKPARSWAWNATYHRGCIRRAEKDLIYHRSKLEVALTHKKQELA